MFDFDLYTQVSDSGPHGPLVSHEMSWMRSGTYLSQFLRVYYLLILFPSEENNTRIHCHQTIYWKETKLLFDLCPRGDRSSCSNWEQRLTHFPFSLITR